MLVATLLASLVAVGAQPAPVQQNPDHLVIRETPIIRSYVLSARTMCGNAAFEIEISVDGETSRVVKATVDDQPKPVTVDGASLESAIMRSRVTGISPSFCSTGSSSIRLAVQTYSSQLDGNEGSNGETTLMATVGSTD